MIPSTGGMGRDLRRLLGGPIARSAQLPGADRYRKHFRASSHLWMLVLYGLLNAASLRQFYALLAVNPLLCRTIGLTRAISFSQLARSSTSRPAACVEALFTDLLQVAQRRPARRGSLGYRLRRILILDSSFVPLCATLSPWSRVGGFTPGVKLQAGYALDRAIPRHLVMDPVSINDQAAIDRFDLTPYRGWTLLFDMGYYAHRAFARMQEAGVGFITQRRVQASYVVTATREVTVKRTPEGDRLIADQTITLGSPNNRRGAVVPNLRLVTSENAQGRRLQFVTNRFDLTATEIVRLYRRRWQIELFFRFLKHQLAVLTPIGRSPQAVWLTILIAAILTVLLMLSADDKPAALSHVQWLSALFMLLLLALHPRGG